MTKAEGALVRSQLFGSVPDIAISEQPEAPITVSTSPSPKVEFELTRGEPNPPDQRQAITACAPDASDSLEPSSINVSSGALKLPNLQSRVPFPDEIDEVNVTVASSKTPVAGSRPPIEACCSSVGTEVNLRLSRVASSLRNNAAVESIANVNECIALLQTLRKVLCFSCIGGHFISHTQYRT